MPTSIDSLQIEIESNSTSASQEIRNLAKSLGELKANGTVSTAIKNLENLSEKLKNFADASSAAASIGSLAASLERLQGVRSIRPLANSLGRLDTALKGIETIHIDGLAPKLERIAAAVAPLSAVKAGGLNTMANGLLKISEVTKALDDATIDAFAERVQKVSEKLGPLSEKMTTIRAGFSAINSRARKASGGVRAFGRGLNTAAVNMSSFATIIQSAVHWMQRAIDRFQEFLAEAIEWEGIAQRFGRGFGPQAQETYEWIQKLNQEMGINTQQFMQYASVYATMLKGFGVAQEDAGKMALGYMELTYDIWAGYNDQYKHLSDAADAVKSAIAGEVEPVRKAGFTIVEATLKQTAANHGLTVSLESATEAQKSYLRYLTMVDQAYDQGLVGTYAKEMNTAEGLMRTLAQQTKSLAQAFGSLFLPVLVRVVPYMQAFVELLSEAVRWIAGLVGIEIQEVSWDSYNSGVEDAVEGTDQLGASAKEAKRQLLGIDELNVLNAPASSGGAGGGSGFEDLPVDSLWDKSIFDGIQQQTKELKENLRGILAAAAAIGTAFLLWKISGPLMAALNTVWQLLGAMLGRLTVLTPAAAKLGSALKFAGVLAVLATIVARIVDLYSHSEKFRTGLERLGQLGKLAFEGIKTVAGDLWTLLKDFGGFLLDLLPEEWRQGILDFFGQFQAWAKTLDLDWKDLALTIGGIALLFLPGGKLLGAALLGFEGISVGLRALGGISEETWNEFLNTASAVFSAVYDYFKGMAKGFIEFFVGAFTGDWTLAWQGLKDLSSATLDGIGQLSEALFGVNIVESVKGGFEKIRLWFDTAVRPKFTKAYWIDLAKGIKEGLSEAVRNGVNVAVGHLNRFIDWVNEKLTFDIPALNIAGKQISEAKTIKLFTIPHIPEFAGGGFPETGEMFIARENGIPEMVGRMGGRPAVANNEQIVEGVADGVSRANEELAGVFYAVGQQIVNAINSKEGGVYLDRAKVGQMMTATQAAQSRMYGR